VPYWSQRALAASIVVADATRCFKRLTGLKRLGAQSAPARARARTRERATQAVAAVCKPRTATTCTPSVAYAAASS
jgi:hypothetical protein